MDDRERIVNFYSRFGLPIDAGVETNRFRNRLLSAWTGFVTRFGHVDHIEIEFAMLNGSTYRKPEAYLDRGETVRTWLSESVPHRELIRRFQALLGAISIVPERSVSSLVVELSRAINLSPGIDLRIERIGEVYELLPAGASLLDGNAVIPALEWLRAYPSVRAEFGVALRILADRDGSAYRHAQDSLRKALEDLLKQLLSNNTRLEEQSRPLKDWLAIKGVHEELGNTTVTVMNLIFKHYQNASVKHDKDAGSGNQQEWSAFEVEYLVYQFATLMRVLMEASRMPDGVA
jgi:hypothetical protein